MSDYKFDKNDGKIHTRYSELVRCTPGQIDRVLAERAGSRQRFVGESMLDGVEAHLQWEMEAKRTGKIPECFDLDWPVSHVELELASEMFPGVVVHSRIDSVCADIETVVDYKTVVDGKNGWQANIKPYGNSKQLPFYAFQLGLHGIRIRRGAYLCEIWSQDKKTILDYKVVKKELAMSDIATVLPWVRDRVAVLVSALKEVRGEQ